MTDETGLLVGELRGYRAWILSSSSSRGPRTLSSIIINKPWNQNPIPAAECKIDQTFKYAHEGIGGGPESKDCRCGYNAFYRPENLLWSVHGKHHIPVGAVRATGQAWLHETGFRASRVEILALAPNPMSFPTPGLPPWMSWRFGVPDQERANHLTKLKESYQKRNKAHLQEVDHLRDVAKRLGVPYYDAFSKMCEDFPPTHENEPIPVVDWGHPRVRSIGP